MLLPYCFRHTITYSNDDALLSGCANWTLDAGDSGCPEHPEVEVP